MKEIPPFPGFLTFGKSPCDIIIKASGSYMDPS